MIMKSRTILFALAACLLVTVAIGWQTFRSEASSPSVVVYNSPTCGCCVKWIDMLEEAGFEVVSKNLTNVRAAKQQYGVSRELSSCHTAIVDDRYVVEGHVPIDLVKKMVKEQPDIKGIAVPGMPIGSPGMEGPNPVPYDVLAFTEGDSVYVYASITP